MPERILEIRLVASLGQFDTARSSPRYHRPASAPPPFVAEILFKKGEKASSQPWSNDCSMIKHDRFINTVFEYAAASHRKQWRSPLLAIPPKAGLPLSNLSKITFDAPTCYIGMRAMRPFLVFPHLKHLVLNLAAVCVQSDFYQLEYELLEDRDDNYYYDDEEPYYRSFSFTHLDLYDNCFKMGIGTSHNSSRAKIYSPVKALLRRHAPVLRELTWHLSESFDLMKELHNGTSEATARLLWRGGEACWHDDMAQYELQRIIPGLVFDVLWYGGICRVCHPLAMKVEV